MSLIVKNRQLWNFTIRPNVYFVSFYFIKSQVKWLVNVWRQNILKKTGNLAPVTKYSQLWIYNSAEEFRETDE